MLVQTTKGDNSISYQEDVTSLKIGIRATNGANCLNIIQTGDEIEVKFDYPVTMGSEKRKDIHFKVTIE